MDTCLRMPTANEVPLVGVVVVHWSNLDDTIECLASLSKVDYSRLRVVVVNNGSHDFDPKPVLAACPWASIVTSEDNLGFSGGTNLGVVEALRQGADVILMLNNDTVVRPDLVRALLPSLAEPNVGVIGPVITYYDDPARVWYAGGSYSRLMGFPHRRRPLLCPAADQRVDYVNGCALLVKREVLEKIGMLREDLFLYYEEADFCIRAARAGYRCVLVAKPLVSHKVSAGAGVRGTGRFTPVKAYYFARNSLLSLRRNESGPWLLTGIVSHFLLVLPYFALQCIVVMDVRVIGALLVGIWHGIIGRSGRYSHQP